MSILIKNGDYVPDGKGSVMTVSGGEDIICEVLFRLSARRGSFPLLPEFGSRIYRLRGEKSSVRTALARQYAVEALSELENVSVTDAAVSVTGDRLLIRVELLWQGQALTVEVEG